MAKTKPEVVICGTCYQRFEGKDAARQLQEHYAAFHPSRSRA